MQAVAGIPALVEQIEGARAEGVVQPGRHAIAPLGEFGLALDHCRWWRPGRPFALHGDAGRALPLETFAANADAIAHGLAITQDKVKELFLGIDDHRAGLFFRLISHDLAVILARHLAYGDARQLIASIDARPVIVGKDAHWSDSAAPSQCRGQHRSKKKFLHAHDNVRVPPQSPAVGPDRKSTRLNSSHVKISYAVFC